jgi:uncharacterized protein YkwD
MKTTSISRRFAACVALLAFFGLSAAASAATYKTVSGAFSYGYAQQVFTLVNQQRKAYGLPDLIMTQNLTDSAMKRAAECAVLFEHTRPNGDSCFTAFPGDSVGENIAYGQSSPSAVMNWWMNSEGHRNNILTRDKYGNIYYTDRKFIGIGCFQSGNTLYWVQVFSDTTTSGTDTRFSDHSATVKVSQTRGTDSIVTIGGPPVPSGSFTRPTASKAKYAGCVRVAWKKNSFSNCGYYVYRTTTKKFKNPVRLGWTKSLSYLDKSAKVGASYWYWIVPSRKVFGKIYVATPPSGTAATAKQKGFRNFNTPVPKIKSSTSGVTLTWKASKFAKNGYEVWRGTSRSVSKAGKIATTKRRKYVDRNTVPGRTYYYWICVRGPNDRWLAAQNWKKGVRKLAFPVPHGSGSGYSVRISWKAVKGAKKYKVYRGSTWASRRLMKTTTGRYWIDRSCPRDGRWHYYWVCAVDIEGRNWCHRRCYYGVRFDVPVKR